MTVRLLKEALTVAIEALSWIELQGMSERSALSKTVKQLGIKDSRALGLAHKLVYETVRRRNLIDRIANTALAPGSLEDFRLGVRAFLRLYVYQTKFVNGDFEEAASMAGLGRSILGWRELQEVEEALGKILSIKLQRVLGGAGDEERVGFLTCHPRWFVDYCFRLLGRREALRFLESSMETLPTYIRINTLRGSGEALLKRVEEDGVVLEEVQQLKHTYKVVESTKPLVRTESFRDGLFYIQDKASCLAVEVADPEPGMTVLDICAAPGAKTTYLAQLMENEGVVYSVDFSRRRMRIWKRETRRMGVEIAVPTICDTCKPLAVKVSADLVILDPPCTSTGVFSRMPSAKWRLTEDSMMEMSEFQWRMLNGCVKYVKVGGFLGYSSCSIAVEENEMLIERVLKLHPEFKLVDAPPKIGVSGLRGLTECQRLYPHIHDCNGFFVAKLLREDS
ncbi:MAG: RsmB/NOP family class I SAM-dependent RNA methyltransferase [Candidatus Bathyarchaeia archaeon]